MALVILKMTISIVLYLIITVVLWHYWTRHEHSMRLKAAVGIIYGAASIASTHLGADYFYMVINVRDLGPLAAGLFFDPVSGIIAGAIGGVERYIVGTFYGVGTFTTIACSLSNLLAGFLAAILHLYFFKGKRPLAFQALFIGMVMEVFHMYAILLTHRDDMNSAYFIVKFCAVPMIVASGIGLMACTIAVLYLSGAKYEHIRISDHARTPIARRFYRRLLAVTLLVFAVNHVMDYNFQTRNTYQQAQIYLRNLAKDFQKLYSDTNGDVSEMKKLVPYITMTSNDSVLYMIYDNNGQIAISSISDGQVDLSGIVDVDMELPDTDLKYIQAQPDNTVFRMTLEYYWKLNALCLKIPLDGAKGQNLLLSWDYDILMENQVNKAYELLLSDVLLFTVLYLLTVILVEQLVSRNLKAVNGSLQKIISGDLNEKIEVRDSAEFSLLSDDINQTVTTLKGYIDESRKRMEQELALAAFIQESALPHVFTFTRNDFEIYALMKPARQVGGDFYDFFFTDINKMALVIADVSGKGVPAAMFMMRAKTAIVNTARIGKSPSEVLFEVNNILCEGNDAEMFVTAWIGIIDLETGFMRCANAGHEYPVLCRAGGEYELVKDKHGLVLGAMENVPMNEYTLQIEPGDRIFVYTDGVPEAIDKEENAYGTDRLVRKLNTVRNVPQQVTLEQVHSDMVEFVGEAEQFDDITMLGFTYNGKDKM